MLRKSIEPGTKVFHLDYGFGTFIKWYEKMNEVAIIKFEQFKDVNVSIMRKYLTEIEPEEKQEHEFNPPV